jgi:hypothetical protein
MDATTSGPRLACTVEDFAASTGLGRSRLYKAIRNGRRTTILAEDGRAFLASLPELRVA